LEEKRRREVQHTVKVTVRFSPEDHAVLEEVAKELRAPVAVLLRQWSIDRALTIKADRARAKDAAT